MTNVTDAPISTSSAFGILETLALVQGQFRHQAEHLARMARSAAYFSHPWCEAEVRQAMTDLAKTHGAGLWRVRLVLSAQGQVQAEAHAMVPTVGTVRLQLATRPLLEAHSDVVRHKLTQRGHYDAFTPTRADVFDTLLWNEAGELTECTRGNVAVQVAGRWLTPALTSGLLPGVGREVALREGRLTEAVLRLDDVPRVQAWAFVNSLRGWLDAEVV